jgi:hypothetical protein
MERKLSITVEPTKKKPRKKVIPSTAYSKDNPSPAAFKPGVSGNPSGRPKDENRLLSRSIRVHLSARASDEVCLHFKLPKRSSSSQCLAAALVKMALRGDINAFREIREATEGTRSKFEFTDAQGDPLALPALEVYLVPTNREPELVQTIDAATLDAGTE